MRLSFAEHFAAMVEYVCESVHSVGAEHGNACLPEVGYSLEYRTCRKMTPGVKYATIFVNAVDVDAQLLKQNI